MCHYLGISSVNKLDLTFNNNPSITWSPPSFYSNDIPQGSITTYHVYIVNQYGSIIIDDNTTDTSYLLPSNYIVCIIYTASITAFIDQYKSLATTISKEISGSKLQPILHLYYILLYYQTILSTYLAML